RLGLARDRPIIALCPGAEYGPAKRWPVAYYAEIAQSSLSTGRAVWIFGSRNDAPIGSAIAVATPGAVDLCGRTNLSEARDHAAPDPDGIRQARRPEPGLLRSVRTGRRRRADGCVGRRRRDLLHPSGRAAQCRSGRGARLVGGDLHRSVTPALPARAADVLRR